jgi:hypothetical protein
MARQIGGANRGYAHVETFVKYTGATVNDLVKFDATGNHKVALCADGDKIDGIVRYVSPNPNGGVSVELPSDQRILNLPFTGALARGASVVASATRGSVKTAAANGTEVLAVDSPSAGRADIAFPFAQ